MTTISRRNFLKLGVLGGTALLLGVYLGTGGELVKGPTEVWDDLPGTFEPNAWLRLNSDGSVLVRINHSEMGQGITTGLAMIIAEELDAGWDRVSVEIAPAEAVYKNPAFNVQMTGDSTSTRTSWNILRQAGAAARQMLVQAAATTWSVPISECWAEKGQVIHQPSGKKLSYGQLVSLAAQLAIPENVTLKISQDYKIIGRSYPRLDTPIKCTGEAIFGIDAQVPELLNAVVVRPPTIGAKIKTWDANQVMSSPGMRHVVEIDAGIAVVASTFWQAKKAAEQLRVEWTEGNATLSSDTLRQQWIELAKTQEGRTRYQKGNSKDALAGATRIIQAIYELPYQAHATPEPMNCTAYVSNGKCDIWAPTQNQDAAQEVAARITGLAYRDINIHTTYLGGGFGRRISVDYVAEAVQISHTLGKPVKVIWSREDDIRHDFYRPGSYNILQAGLDPKGKIIAWTHKIVGPDYMAEGLPVLFPSMLPYGVPRGARNLASSISNAVIPTIIPGAKVVEGATDLPYAIDNIQVNHVNADPGIPKGFWRSVAFSTNTFVVESFLDEIAAETGQDPFTLREQLLVNSPRLRNVLRLAAEKVNWGQQSPAGVYRGMAALDFQGAMLSIVAEVSVAGSGAVQVHRMVGALDCGIAINPKLVTTQMESGIVFGLTAALKSQITVKNGKVMQSNFHDFPLLRMNEMPQVEIHIIPSDQPPLGVGESAVPLVAPAVANAIFAATGKRIRKLPVDSIELSSPHS
ncbi:xanthine dehydrogenase YagR molybdenum-binding subunit [Anaerolineae bacterium]|nr:xanthine dehydrogenase YagR molybdenum-binding subunit [Anaerolineae bacterium]